MSDVPPRPLLQRLQSATARLATENLLLKGLSLFVAVGIWAWLQREQVVMARARARINYTWPADLVLVNDLTGSAMINVRGPQGVVRTLDSRELSISVDLSESGEGTHAIDFTDKPVRGLPSGVQVVQVSPVGAQVEFDQPMTRQVKVRPAVIGEVADGYRRVAVTVDPDVVEITGPQSLVRNIAEVSTDIIDISGFTDSKSVQVPLAIERRSVKPVASAAITLRVEVEPLLATRVFNDVQVVTRAGGWRAAPDQVRLTLEGPATELKRVDPGEISVLLHLPSPTPVGETVEVEWRQGDAFTDNDGGVQVVLPPSLPEPTRMELTPARFTLEPEDAP
jgi:YbbR domain-containing protein